MRTHDINGFSGLNITDDPTRIKESEFAKCENGIVTNDGTLKKRTGYKSFLADYPTSEEIKNFYQYITIDGEHRLILISDGEVWQYYNSEWSQINEVDLDSTRKLGIETYYDKLFVADKENGVFVYKDTVLSGADLIVGVAGQYIYFYDAITLVEREEFRIFIDSESTEAIGAALSAYMDAVDLRGIKIYGDGAYILLYDTGAEEDEFYVLNQWFEYLCELDEEAGLSNTNTNNISINGSLLLMYGDYVGDKLLHFNAYTGAFIKAVTPEISIPGGIFDFDGVSNNIIIAGDKNSGVFPGTMPFPFWQLASPSDTGAGGGISWNTPPSHPDWSIVVKVELQGIESGAPAHTITFTWNAAYPSEPNISSVVNGNVGGNGDQYQVYAYVKTWDLWYGEVDTITLNMDYDLDFGGDNIAGVAPTLHISSEHDTDSSEITTSSILGDISGVLLVNLMDIDTGLLNNGTGVEYWNNTYWVFLDDNPGTLTLNNIKWCDTGSWGSSLVTILANKYLYKFRLHLEDVNESYLKAGTALNGGGFGDDDDLLLINRVDDNIYCKKLYGETTNIIKLNYNLEIIALYDDKAIYEYIFKTTFSSPVKKMVRLMSPENLVGMVVAGAGAGENDSAKYFVTYFFDDGSESMPSLTTNQLDKITVGVTDYDQFKIVLMDVPQGIIDAGLSKIKVYRATESDDFENFYYIGDITDFDEKSYTDDGDEAQNVYVAMVNNYKFSIVKIYLNRLILAGNPLIPSYVVFSETDDPEVIDLSSHREVNLDDKDVVTAVEPLQNQLIIFKENHLYVILGDVEDGTLMSIEEKVGALSQHVVASLKSVTYHMDRRGFYEFNGNRSLNISDQKIKKYFDPTYEYRIDMSEYEKFRIIIRVDENKVKWLIIDINGDRKLLCYNYVKGTWTTESYYHNMTEMTEIKDETTKDLKYILGDEDGQLWELDKNEHDDGNEDISYDIITKKFDMRDPIHEKWFKKVFFNAITNLELAGAYRIDEGEWKPFELTQDDDIDFVSNKIKIMNGRGKYIQLRIVGSDKKVPFDINGIEFKYKQLESTGRGR